MMKCKKCGKTISIMEEHCEECKKKMSLREKVVDDINRDLKWEK